MEQKQLEDNLNNLMEAFDNHSHCIKCKKPMPADVRYRDGVCDNCSTIKKQQQGKTPPMF